MWDFASIGNCRTLNKLKREILAIIQIECQDPESREFYTTQIDTIMDSLHDFIEKK